MRALSQDRNSSGPAFRAPLSDSFGRRIDYLRVSVTDRCDFRCVYCMAEDTTFLPRGDLLTLEELDRICSAFVARGVRKLRLTGGEPLVRRGIMRLFRTLSRHLASGALNELTLTTNGSQLARYAVELAACGVRRVNVSLDTLDPEKFRTLTRCGELAKVLAGIDAAQAAGLAVKINTVALKGVNEDELVPLLEWAHGRGMDLTLIEVMPLGEGMVSSTEHFMPLDEAISRLSGRFALEATAFATGGPARYLRVRETGGRLGLISPLSQSFCDNCNRIRITCAGALYLCLGREETADFRAAVRASPSDTTLQTAITAALARKPSGHNFVAQSQHAQNALPRPMSLTGG